jgi:hypothetical protein
MEGNPVNTMNARTPLIPRPDGIARALVFVGSLMHGIGANILKARNEELAEQLAGAEQFAHAGIRHAYALGRIHEAGDAPAPSPSALHERIAGMVERFPLDVDEHQGDEPVTPDPRDASTGSTHDASRLQTASERDASPSTGATPPVAPAAHDASPSWYASAVSRAETAAVVGEHQGAGRG